MRNNITYAVDEETGLVWSRMGDKVAGPILDYDAMLPDNGYEAVYHLEIMPLNEIVRFWSSLRWTKKIPIEVKNTHREFWGIGKIKGRRNGQ